MIVQLEEIERINESEIDTNANFTLLERKLKLKYMNIKGKYFVYSQHEGDESMSWIVYRVVD